MRFLAAVLVVGACYAPTFPAGAPCDPDAPSCPGDQTCGGVAGGFFCMSGPGGSTDAPMRDAPDLLVDASDAHHPDGLSIDAMNDAAIDAIVIDAHPDAPLPPLHIDYPATVADCIDPTSPDPQKCINKNGNNQMAVDANDTALGNPWNAYVRFDLDGQIAGRTVTQVRLVMVASSDAKASSPESGAVYAASAFTHASLLGTTPAQGVQLAPQQGSVIQLQTVMWTLPVGTVAANQPVYLGITTSNSDGTTYWNLTGTTPPVLHVDTN